eukprot:4429611-Heterocapsa_arctica.AAC.1
MPCATLGSVGRLWHTVMCAPLILHWCRLESCRVIFRPFGMGAVFNQTSLGYETCCGYEVVHC